MTSCTGSVRGGFWGDLRKVSESSFYLRRRRLTFRARRGLVEKSPYAQNFDGIMCGGKFMDSILKCFEGEILLAELIKVWLV